MNKSQHGFTKRKSTMTAVRELMDWVQIREEKYVIGIFLDISGAFDDVAWKPLIDEMVNLRASQGLVCMTMNYLLDRTAFLSVGSTTVKTILTKSCPQGLGFGPTLWNITVNGILNSYHNAFAHRVVYADDIVALVAGNTR